MVGDVTSQVDDLFQNMELGCGVEVADLYGALQGRKGMLLIERNQANPLEIHPTNAGYKVMAKAFRDAMAE